MIDTRDYKKAIIIFVAISLLLMPFMENNLFWDFFWGKIIPFICVCIIPAVCLGFDYFVYNLTKQWSDAPYVYAKVLYVEKLPNRAEYLVTYEYLDSYGNTKTYKDKTNRYTVAGYEEKMILLTKKNGESVLIEPEEAEINKHKECKPQHDYILWIIAIISMLIGIYSYFMY